MYLLLLILLLVAGGILLRRGLGQRRPALAWAGGVILALTFLFFGLLSFWGEMLWFEALGQSSRFWTKILAQAGLALGGALLGGLWLCGLLVWPMPSIPRPAVYVAVAGGFVVGALFGLASWDEVLRFWHGPETGETDPIFGQDIAFYLFTLPFYDRLFAFLVVETLLGLGATLLYLLMFRTRQRGGTMHWGEVQASLTKMRLGVWRWQGGILWWILSWGACLQAYHLMFSQHGVVHGPGWTDVHIRLPAFYALAALLALGGILWLATAWRREPTSSAPARAARSWGPPAAVGLVWLIGLVILPALTQWLYVQPNELRVEKPYIAHNIRFTRQGFRLHDIEEKQFPVSPKFNRAMAEDHRQVLSQVRLWDPRALLAVYEQFQEIRLYYEFLDVDIDRYTVDEEYMQVMVSPREMEPGNLPAQSQTFVNRRFKYTHGYGLTMAPVSRFTQGGLPDLLIRDLPPSAASPQLEVTRPEIYYGEATAEHVVVNSEAKEFDYPSGEHNVYVHYAGRGGVPLDSLWRKFLFGWKFDGTRFFLSGYPTRSSRIMFHRRIHERVSRLAPFLVFDEDPYIVLHEGRLLWMVDAYTVSGYYPYSQPFQAGRSGAPRETRPTWPGGSSSSGAHLHGRNYVRNAVKAVVDAYDGSVDFYVFDEADPLIQAWRSIFPRLLKSREAMPEGLRAHVRYPEGMLLVQGLIYARYHMADPEVFYNQEDLWVRATEKYYANVQPIEPYYVMWQPPGSEEAEFILMLPFTPKNRQVLIAWLAGMCDEPNYGRLLAYRFPKEKRVLGTQQVETKIDQDPFLSQRLSLWDQRGSRVVRGNVLVIPVGDTVLYVEPIYLQAESAAYPELRLVAVMHDDRLSYAESFDQALAGLFGEDQARPPSMAPALPKGSVTEQIQQAGEAFDRYLEALGNQEFQEASRQLERLSRTLKQLQTNAPAQPTP